MRRVVQAFFNRFKITRPNVFEDGIDQKVKGADKDKKKPMLNRRRMLMPFFMFIDFPLCILFRIGRSLREDSIPCRALSLWDQGLYRPAPIESPL